MSENNVVEVLFGLIPLLDKITVAIEESSGAIPKATTQLSSVSQATEVATVEILNVLDRMAERMAAAELNLRTVKEGATGGPRVQKAIACMEAALTESRQDSLNITMALQVQDITSQQIAGVTHMIESVRTQLVEVLGYLDQREKIPWAGQISAPAVQLPTHFDTNAQYSNSTQRQDNADAIVRKWTRVDNE